MIARPFIRIVVLFLVMLFATQIFGQSNICRPEMDSHFTLISHDDGSSSGAFRFSGSLNPSAIPHSNGTAGGVWMVQSNEGLLDRVYLTHSLPDFDFSYSDLSHGEFVIHFWDGVHICRIAVTIQLEGCTDPDATNYNPDATISNGLCEYEDDVCPSIFQIDTTPPDCGEENGSITVIASGANLRFSINGGASFSSSGTFDNLGQGPYQLLVENPSEGCSDSEAILLFCGDVILPEGSCPEITGTTIDQVPSTCLSSDGTVIIHTNTFTNMYRLVGVTQWQFGRIISGVPAGTHTIEVQERISGCSTTGSVTVGCIPSCSDGRRNGTETGLDCGGSCAPCCPEDLGVQVTNYPYCPSDQDGSIVIGARGVSLQYSINNGASWSASPVFNNLRGNTSYGIKVRSTANPCEELSLSYFLPCEDPCPKITGIETSVVANCDASNSGVIQINLGEGQGNIGDGKGISGNGTPTYEFSIDGGNTWSGVNIFTVGTGTYNVLVRNNETGCGPVGQVVTVGCTSCFDGIQNGDETGVDCGGANCHVCEGCPSIEDIKASEAQGSSGEDGGGSKEGKGKSGGLEGQETAKALSVIRMILETVLIVSPIDHVMMNWTTMEMICATVQIPIVQHGLMRCVRSLRSSVKMGLTTTMMEPLIVQMGIVQIVGFATLQEMDSIEV